MKKDEKEYEPESLKVMIAAIYRYVKEKCGYSVLKDREINKSWKVLNGKPIELHRNGMGKSLESQTLLQHKKKTCSGKKCLEKKIQLQCYTAREYIFSTFACKVHYTYRSNRESSLLTFIFMYLLSYRDRRF